MERHKSLTVEKAINAIPGNIWFRSLNTTLHKRDAKEPLINIKGFIYNETKGVSTLLVGDQAITIKLSDDCEHDPYAAFTALVTKYVMRSQSAIVREVDKMKTIKPLNEEGLLDDFVGFGDVIRIMREIEED